MEALKENQNNFIWIYKVKIVLDHVTLPYKLYFCQKTLFFPTNFTFCIQALYFHIKFVFLLQTLYSPPQTNSNVLKLYFLHKFFTFRIKALYFSEKLCFLILSKHYLFFVLIYYIVKFNFFFLFGNKACCCRYKLYKRTTSCKLFFSHTNFIFLIQTLYFIRTLKPEVQYRSYEVTMTRRYDSYEARYAKNKVCTAKIKFVWEK